MIPTVQEEIQTAYELAQKDDSTLEALIEAMPHIATIKGKPCSLVIYPCSGGINMVDYQCIMTSKRESVIHIERVTSVKDAIRRTIRALWEIRDQVEEM